jgi:thioredoxin reductase
VFIFPAGLSRASIVLHFRIFGVRNHHCREFLERKLTVDVVDIAIVGAGPYGLSLAAHLKNCGRIVRIFGSPMKFWSHHMPQGMHLKSEGFASSLSDPTSGFPLKAYCAEMALPYADVGLPVPLETFISYGLEFQRRYVPHVENAQITSVKEASGNFELTTETTEIVRARQVVIAAGISNFAFIPPALEAVPKTLLSHSSRHSDLNGFGGRRVAVLGAGASAVDIAALLQKAGAEVDLIARRSKIQFHDAPKEPRALLERLKEPRSGLGLGWRSRMCTDIPLVFHAMPESMRLRIVSSHLGPAPCWFLRDAVVGRLPMHLGATITNAVPHGEKVSLEFSGPDQERKKIEVDHIIAATGYKVAVSKLQFIDQPLRSRIAVVADTPILNRQFESSVKGLHFVGAAAANSFGPLLRFAYGAEYTATRLARHLARN